jgi:DNA processing protein
MTSPTERAAVVALAAANLVPWYAIAELVTDVGSALAIVDGHVSDIDRADRELVDRLTAAVSRDRVEQVEREVDELLRSQANVALHTVLDESYPANLRQIYNRPPFIFVRGTLLPRDDDAIAIVGTRSASSEGRALARELAVGLVRRDVTIVSGLARGIDTEAHSAALDAGGRTIAVMGTGINRIYPSENRELAEAILSAGALVSQFLPDAPPRRDSFPIRNAVTSGIAVGTAVIEASSTSGAKMQARLALEHGKRLFLVEHLVMQEQWARDYATRPGAVVVTDVQQIVDAVHRRPERVEQLKLV